MKKILSNKLYYLDYITRIFSLLLTIAFQREFVKSAGSGAPVPLRVFIFDLILAIGCNFGLWLSTTKIGKKYPIITTLLMMPTILGGPMLAVYYHATLGIILLIHLFFVIFFLYRYRNNERRLTA